MKFFTELLFDTRHGVLEFHFEREGYPSTSCYNVAVTADINSTYKFSMKENEEKWNIVNPWLLPQWIREMEDVLSNSICVHRTRSAGLSESEMAY